MATAGYTSGWFDTSIYDFLLALGEIPSGMSYSLITVIDSSTEPAKCLEKGTTLAPLRGKTEVVGSGLLLPTRELVEANRANRLFFGFDEIWFFPSIRRTGNPLTSKPPQVSLVEPGGIESQMLPQLQQWMRTSQCSLGLGDGEGMNFCARLSGFAAAILNAFAQSEARSRSLG
ncbi:MAG TPA: hypothetical protein VHV77_08090 [Pirellulales bacterium]|nr:hypothetical protein [Pirellulales bacterium]